MTHFYVKQSIIPAIFHRYRVSQYP